LEAAYAAPISPRVNFCHCRPLLGVKKFRSSKNINRLPLGKTTAFEEVAQEVAS